MSIKYLRFLIINTNGYEWYWLKSICYDTRIKFEYWGYIFYAVIELVIKINQIKGRGGWKDTLKNRA